LTYASRQGFSAIKLFVALAAVLALAFICTWFPAAGSPLFAMVESGDQAAAQSLLRAEPGQVNAKFMGRTPLHLAAIKNNLAMVKLLLAGGASLEAPDAQGNTPLHLAAHCLRLEVARYLLGQGAQVGARNLFGDTPLHQVAFAAYHPVALKLARLLVERGARVEALNHQGYTPANLAGFNERMDMVKLLGKLEAGSQKQASMGNGG
jgi:ankyrin repeat protein